MFKQREWVEVFAPEKSWKRTHIETLQDTWTQLEADTLGHTEDTPGHTWTQLEADTL